MMMPCLCHALSYEDPCVVFENDDVAKRKLRIGAGLAAGLRSADVDGILVLVQYLHVKKDCPMDGELVPADEFEA